jgi:hypothetical protein
LSRDKHLRELQNSGGLPFVRNDIFPFNSSLFIINVVIKNGFRILALGGKGIAFRPEILVE